MALITERVQKEAKKCFDCIFKKMQDKFDKKVEEYHFDDEGFSYKGVKYSLETIMRASCAMCPNREQFVKLFGLEPYEYFKNEMIRHMKR
jgi:hypothetical protein